MLECKKAAPHNFRRFEREGLELRRDGDLAIDRERAKRLEALNDLRLTRANLREYARMLDLACLAAIIGWCAALALAIRWSLS